MLEPYKAQIAQVAVESTYNWYWLVDGLEDHGYPVVLANPARMQQYNGLKHTDDVSDAYFLCELHAPGHPAHRPPLRPPDAPRARSAAPAAAAGATAHRLILSFKSLNERTLGQRVPLARVKAMSIEEAQARFTAPADQLLSGEQIGLMGQLQESISRIEKHILAATRSGRPSNACKTCPASARYSG